MITVGWRPDPPPSKDERDDHRARVAALISATFGALPKAGAIPWPRWQLSQLGQSCEGHYTVAALYGLLGNFRGSPYFPWWFARATDAQKVEDVGVSTFALIRAAERHGIPPWDEWNPSLRDFTLTREPPALARMAAQKHKLEITPIWDMGHAAAVAVCAAIAQGLPVGIVVDVDAAFERPKPGQVIGAPVGEIRGRHIGTGWEYRTTDAGKIEVFFHNSWSAAWGDDGGIWLSEERLVASPFLCYARLGS